MRLPFSLTVPAFIQPAQPFFSTFSWRAVTEPVIQQVSAWTQPLLSHFQEAEVPFYIKAQSDTGFRQHHAWRSAFKQQLRCLQKQIIQAYRNNAVFPADKLYETLIEQQADFTSTTVSALFYDRSLRRLAQRFPQYAHAFEGASHHLKESLKAHPQKALRYFYQDLINHLILSAGNQISLEQLIEAYPYYQPLIPKRIYQQSLTVLQTFNAARHEDASSAFSSLSNRDMKELLVQINQIFAPKQNVTQSVAYDKTNLTVKEKGYLAQFQMVLKQGWQTLQANPKTLVFMAAATSCVPSSAQTLDLSVGQVAAYNFNNNVYDVSGQGYDATYLQGSYQPALLNYGLYANNTLPIPNTGRPIATLPSAAIPVYTGSLCAWMKLVSIPNSFTNAQEIAFFTENNNVFNLAFTSNEGLAHSGWVFAINGGNNRLYTINSFGTTSTSTLGSNSDNIHLCALWNQAGIPAEGGRTLALYRNAVNIGTYYIAPTSTWPSSFGNFSIHTERYNPAYANNAPVLNIIYDDVRIYNRVLSAAEIQSLYSGPVIYYPLNNNTNDVSGYGNNGIYLQGTYQQGPISNGLYANNDNPILSFPTDVIPISRGTICTWLNLVSVPSTMTNAQDMRFIADNSTLTTIQPQFGVLFGTNDGRGCGGWQVMLQGYQNQQYFKYEIYTINSFGTLSTSTLGSNGENIHLCALWDQAGIAAEGGKKLALYRNGVNIGAYYFSTGTGWPSTFGTLNIHRRYSNTDFSPTTPQVQLIYDDLRIYDRVLTAAEIQTLYSTDNGNSTSSGMLTTVGQATTSQQATSDSITTHQQILTTGGDCIPSSSLSHGLIAAYTFDNTVNDMSGNGYDATYLQGSYQPALLNYGLYANNDNPIVTLPTNVLPVASGSLCLWTKLLSVPSFMTNAQDMRFITDSSTLTTVQPQFGVLFSTNDGLAHGGWEFMMQGYQNNQYFKYEIYTINSYGTLSTSTLGSANENIHLCALWDQAGIAAENGRKISLYRNAVNIGTYYVSFGTGWPSTFGALNIHRRYSNTDFSPTTPQVQLIYDDLRIYDRVLTAAEIQALYNCTTDSQLTTGNPDHASISCNTDCKIGLAAAGGMVVGIATALAAYGIWRKAKAYKDRPLKPIELSDLIELKEEKQAVVAQKYRA